jgi:hypothetical protein
MGELERCTDIAGRAKVSAYLLLLWRMYTQTPAFAVGSL